MLLKHDPHNFGVRRDRSFISPYFDDPDDSSATLGVFLDLSKHLTQLITQNYSKNYNIMAFENWHVISSVVICVDDLNSFNWAILYLLKDCYSIEFPKVQYLGHYCF